MNKEIHYNEKPVNLAGQINVQLYLQIDAYIYDHLSTHLDNQLFDEVYVHIYDQLSKQLNQQIYHKVNNQLRRI